MNKKLNIETIDQMHKLLAYLRANKENLTEKELETYELLRDAAIMLYDITLGE